MSTPTARKLGRHQPAELPRERESLRPALRETPAELAHRRQPGESGLESLHAAALLVDGDEERWRANRMYFGDEPLELFAALVVPREQDDAADLRMTHQFAVVGLERDAREVHHDRTERHRASFGSKSAIDSTCDVCGNMSMMPAATSR